MKTTMMVLVAVLVSILGFNCEAATWKIKRGDTLSKISSKTGVSVKEIAAANSIKTKDYGKLRIGRVLTIPEKVSASAATVNAQKTEKAQLGDASKTAVVIREEAPPPKEAEKKADVEVGNLTSGATILASVASSNGFTLGPTNGRGELREKDAAERETEATLQRLAGTPLVAPDPVEAYNKKQEQTLLGKMGLSGKKNGINRFVELDATLGGWRAMSVNDSRIKDNPYGLYAQLEIEPWFGFEEPLFGGLEENYGLGVIAKGDYGWQGDNIHWGDVIFGIQPGYWKNFDDRNFLLFKLRFAYRTNEKNNFGDKPQKGFTEGAYIEYNRLMSPLDMLTVSFDGWYFPNDSYASLPIRWEHQLASAMDWKINAGAALTGHWQKDSTAIGGGPVFGFKYKDTIAVGGSVEVNKDGVYAGAFFTYMFNSDRHNPLSLRNRK